MKKIYGGFGVLIGYQEGEYYLWKRYNWQNGYNYILTKRNDMQSCFQVDFDKAYDNKEIKIIKKCAKGKELLTKLNNNEITFDEISSLILF